MKVKLTDPIIIFIGIGGFLIALLDATLFSKVTYDNFNLTWWGWIAISPHILGLAYFIIHRIFYGLIYLNIKRWFGK